MRKKESKNPFLYISEMPCLDKGVSGSLALRSCWQGVLEMGCIG